MKNVYMMRRFRSLIAALILFAFWGCATVEDRPPDWIRGGDALTPQQILAYGRGDSEGEARERARADAAAQIAQVLLRQLESRGTVVTRTVGELVEQRAADRVESQDPADRYQRQDEQSVVEQYLLYEYSPENRTQDLTQIYEEANLAIPVEREVIPESPRGDLPPREESPASPLGEVRTRLATSVPADASSRRETLEDAQEVAGDVDISIEPRQRTVALGRPLPSGFSVVLSAGENEQPLRNVPLQVVIQSPEVDGRRETTELQIRTNHEGTARIPVATPELAGTTQILVEPAWLDEELRPWRAAEEGSATQDLVASIGERLRARAAVQVTSDASAVPTAMIVLDRDIAGNPIASSDTMRGMAQEFAETDFRIREVDLSSSDRWRLAEAESISVADLYDILPFDVLSQTERVIVGHTHILEFTEDDGFTVVVEVEAGAFDLRRDEVLARVSFQERITGSDARSAIRTAFQAAGRRLVRRIVPRLP